jgi:hypothetical protein
MRVKFLLPAALLASTSILCALPVVARPQDNSQQTTDPVADAARRAREAKQQNANKPKKVYTDDDISRPKSAPATTPAPDASNAAEAAAIPSTPDKEKEKEKSDNSDNSEATWRKRFKEQNDKIATAEKELDILQREGQKAQIQYYPDPQKAMTEQYTRKEINDKDAKIAAKQDEIAKLKQGLSDLEDQLRAAGGEPGWAR